MKKKNLFSLFPKKLANGTVMYYYTTYDEFGKRKQFSTTKTDKQEAYAECYKRLSKGKILRKSKLILNQYIVNWFHHEKCPYYSIRMAKGRKYSKSSLDNKRLALNKHILPVFGELRMDHITTPLIENWIQSKKKEGYAVNTINVYLSILRLILGEAVRTGIIDRNPCDSVIKYSSSKDEKGILTDEEVKRLFDEENIDNIWTSKMHFLFNYTAIMTGCRIGEILALTKDKICDGYIEVSTSYDRKYGVKSTKSGATRYVPIPKSLQQDLIEFSESNNGRFIFTANNLLKPVNYATVTKNFRKALDNIGVHYKERSITFHSYRHKANTRMRESGISDAIIREIIGHKSSSMTENYSHIDTRTIDFDSLKIV